MKIIRNDNIVKIGDESDGFRAVALYTNGRDMKRDCLEFVTSCSKGYLKLEKKNEEKLD